MLLRVFQGPRRPVSSMLQAWRPGWLRRFSGQGLSFLLFSPISGPGTFVFSTRPLILQGGPELISSARVKSGHSREVLLSQSWEVETGGFLRLAGQPT